MADISLNPSFVPTLRVPRGWLERLNRSIAVMRRRARRDRYLALSGRSSRHYRWFEALFESMSGRY